MDMIQNQQIGMDVPTAQTTTINSDTGPSLALQLYLKTQIACKLLLAQNSSSHHLEKITFRTSDSSEFESHSPPCLAGDAASRGEEFAPEVQAGAVRESDVEMKGHE